ncbi:4-carboxymuconolactone decarboxylase [Phreatobacter cathodiphilus]|uniref:4-carboxymuconolactone decarboxylase n=1 Tax=Phreatobacter cathodiphilus TaxID=1868589 RepID=A0A2S0NB69_9HYPH|nr:4-carboxymuconolactone decarboxylase [Phreatobacter cathodiphilus]AVO45400.1 4-carboxymuconolactone decarboxylase [Phreatobacter cathodiphilus]
MDEKDRFEKGLAVRRAVLGDAHVDRSLAARDGFSGEFQDFITRYAWGEIWTRPGLERKTRSFLVLAICASLGRWEEFRLHCRASFSNGVTTDDIKEVILQIAVYAGVPAANTAMKEAKEVFAELGIKT